MQIHNLKRQFKNKKIDSSVVVANMRRLLAVEAGATARAGNKRRPELRDIIKKLPKNRWVSFLFCKKPFKLSKDKVLQEGVREN